MFAEIFEEALDAFEDDITRGIASKLGPACKEVTKKIREDIHDQWKGHSYDSMNEAAETIPRVRKGKTQVVCTTVTYVEAGKFNPPSQTAESWNARHGGGMGWQDWILSLQYGLGYDNLPSETGGVGPRLPSQTWDWANNRFINRAPLDAVIPASPLWDRFEDEVIQRL